MWVPKSAPSGQPLCRSRSARPRLRLWVPKTCVTWADALRSVVGLRSNCHEREQGQVLVRRRRYRRQSQPACFGIKHLRREAAWISLPGQVPVMRFRPITMGG